MDVGCLGGALVGGADCLLVGGVSRISFLLSLGDEEELSCFKKGASVSLMDLMADVFADVLLLALLAIGPIGLRE